MKTIKVKTTGKSLLELHKEFGTTGPSGFYSNDPWWKNEEFAKVNPSAGTYKIVVSNDLYDKTYEEQKVNLPKGFSPLHPTVLAEAILTHFKNTGERILENWYSRTNTQVSDGSRVYVGAFDADGLDVSRCYDVRRSDNIGLSSARKLPLKSRSLEPIEFSDLESRVKALEEWKNNLFK